GFRVPHAFLIGAVLTAASFNAGTLILRWNGLRHGYQWGENLPVRLKQYRFRDKIRWLRGAGLVAAVSICAVNVFAAYRQGASDGTEGVLLFVGCLLLRHMGVSTATMYAAAGAGSVLFMTARGL